MKVAVCVKFVPDAASDRGFEPDNTTDRTSADSLLSELDEYAVEEALQLVEAQGGEVVVLTVGPDGASAAVKKSLQMGADAGVHVLDPAIAGSDAIATSLVLARALERIAPDLVLTGMGSTDGSMGVIAAMLAERLKWPQATFASELTVEGGVARIRRDGDNATEVVEAPLPCVVSVTDQINSPRHPSFKNIMAAKKKSAETWTLADLGVDPSEVGLAAAWTQVLATTPRPPRAAGVVVADDGTGAAQLVDYLASAKLI